MILRLLLLGASGAAALTSPAAAQAPYPKGSPRSTIAPRLPAPPVSPDAGPQAFLEAARGAVAAGRTGEAEEALERAETRVLDRASLPPGAVAEGDARRAVTDVGAARASLVARDRPGAVHAIDDAIAALQGASATGYAAATSPSPIAPRGVPSAPVQAFVSAAPANPSATYALLPGRWQLEGARYIWIPPDEELRPVTDLSLVGGVEVWRGGRWVYVPKHHADDQGG